MTYDGDLPPNNSVRVVIAGDGSDWKGRHIEKKNVIPELEDKQCVEGGVAIDFVA